MNVETGKMAVMCPTEFHAPAMWNPLPASRVPASSMHRGPVTQIPKTMAIATPDRGHLQRTVNSSSTKQQNTGSKNVKSRPVMIDPQSAPKSQNAPTIGDQKANAPTANPSARNSNRLLHNIFNSRSGLRSHGASICQDLSTFFIVVEEPKGLIGILEADGCIADM